MDLILEIATTLYEANNFNEIGNIIVKILGDFAKGKIFGGKLGIYDKEIDEYKIYFDTGSEIVKTKVQTEIYELTAFPKKFNEIKYYSRIVADTRKKLIIQDNHSEESLKIHSSQKDFEPHAMMFMPLLYKNEFLGIISLGVRPINSITSELIETIEVITKITSIKVSELMETKKTLWSELKYRTLVDTTGTGYVILDSDGKVIDANEEYVRLTGNSSLEQILNKKIEKWIAEYHVQKSADAVKRCMNEGYVRNLEIDYKNKSGIIIPVEINATKINDAKGIKILSLCRDITERRRTKKERDRLFSYSIDMLSILGFDGYFKQVNPAWTKTLGWSQSELLSKPFHDFLFCEDKEKTIESHDKLLEGHILRNFENRYLCSDGSYRWLEWNAFPFKEEELIFSVTRDITAIKISEEEHIRLQNLESLGVLAGGIAHDFNNILTSIMGQASIAHRRTNEESTKKSMLSILESTKKSVGLTHKLLTFAKGGTPQKTNLSIRKLIEETSQFALAGSNLKVEFVFNDSWPLYADEGQISQVIQNLIMNSREAMAEGGQILVFTENISDENKNAFVKIRIKDSGVGIEKDHLEKIFDPYFTTKQTGTGLGLSVCHSIIKKHGGKIIANSELNRGTIMDIYLPSTNPNPDAEEESNSKKLKILIMDDEDSIREIFKEILEELNHSVVESRNGNELLELYKQSLSENQPYDLVFLDLNIKGGMGGKETVKLLRQINPDVKAVVSSGNTDGQTVDNKKDGFDAKLNKPYTIDEIEMILKQVMNV